MRNTIKVYHQKAPEVRKRFTQLKVAFLVYDKINQGRLMLYFNNTEEWLVEHEKKGLWYYFFWGKVEGELLEQEQEFPHWLDAGSP